MLAVLALVAVHALAATPVALLAVAAETVLVAVRAQFLEQVLLLVAAVAVLVAVVPAVQPAVVRRSVVESVVATAKNSSQ